MKRILVVVDGTTESNIAIEYATEFAAGAGEVELLLLYVRHPMPPWERTGKTQVVATPGERILDRASRLAKLAGLAFRTRSEVGEIPETVIRVAREELCDLIVWPEPGMSRVARAVLMLTGFSANAQVNKIISASPVPVTVVTDVNTSQARPLHEIH